jgi:hypothetical protein
VKAKRAAGELKKNGTASIKKTLNHTYKIDDFFEGVSL